MRFFGYSIATAFAFWKHDVIRVRLDDSVRATHWERAYVLASAGKERDYAIPRY